MQYQGIFDNAIASMYIAQNYAGIDVGIKEIIKKIINLVSDMEKPVMDIAGQLNDINTIFVLGSGPNYPVARESAQKIKEATHIHAEGIELEEFNHGCTSIIDDKSLLILIGDGYNNERMNQIVRACRVTGTKTLTLNGSGDFNINIDGFNDIYLNPVLNIVPLYYLAYFMAVQRHINPDLLRFDEKNIWNLII